MHVYVHTMQETAGMFSPHSSRFRHKSKENIHSLLIECVFPLTRSGFCRKQGFLPSLYLGVQGKLHKLDHKVVCTMLALSPSKSPLAWMTAWQMPCSRSISFNRCSWGTSVSFTASPGDKAAGCVSKKGGIWGRSACPLHGTSETGWHRDPAEDSRLLSRGSTQEGNECSLGLGKWWERRWGEGCR